MKFDPTVFVSEEAAAVYYLTVLEGKQRNKALELTDNLFHHPVLAYQWYEALYEKVKHNQEAVFSLRSIYAIISGN